MLFNELPGDDDACWDLKKIPIKKWYYKMFSVIRREIVPVVYSNYRRSFHTSFVPRANDGTDELSKYDILNETRAPLNNIESVLKNGLRLSSGITITSPNEKKEIIGAILLGGETFELNLSSGKENNLPQRELFTITNNFLVKFEEIALQIFKLSYPKPELLVVGLGKKSRVLDESNRKFFSSLGIQLEVSDTRNACQNFDLLATERPNQVGALILPPNV